MTHSKAKWSPNQLKAYVFLFTSNPSCNIQQDKLVYLNRLGVNQIEFNEIEQEFKGDNDYQSVQKICAIAEGSRVARTQLVSSIKEVKNILETSKKRNRFLTRNMFVGLERIVNKAA